ncbi:SemiSWEET family sugar transporter [Prochlorococcus marinus]|nr:SemiSWEET transporter [Prochlorococcus marinus]
MSSLSPIDILGLVAGSLTTAAFVPQLLKVWISKSANDISYLMFILFIIGIVLWEIYGWEIHSMPVILFNIITFILGLAILILKFVFDSRNNLKSKEKIINNTSN